MLFQHETKCSSAMSRLSSRPTTDGNTIVTVKCGDISLDEDSFQLLPCFPFCDQDSVTSDTSLSSSSSRASLKELLQSVGYSSSNTEQDRNVFSDCFPFCGGGVNLNSFRSKFSSCFPFCNGRQK